MIIAVGTALSVYNFHEERRKPNKQSHQSIWFNTVDGRRDTCDTIGGKGGPVWWQVELEVVYAIWSVTITGKLNLPNPFVCPRLIWFLYVQMYNVLIVYLVCAVSFNFKMHTCLF